MTENLMNVRSVAMRVRAIDLVVTNVSNLQEAKTFYQEILGIDSEVLSESETWIEFDTKPVAFALGVPPSNWKQPPVTALALSVDDVHAAVEELRAQGVQVIMEARETPVCTLAYVLDPDGNPIFLHHRHDGTAG